MKSQLQGIMKQYNLITDTFDGSIYQNFIKKEEIGYNFTLTIFTDGISCI